LWWYSGKQHSGVMFLNCIICSIYNCVSLNSATLLLSVIAHNYYPLSIAIYKKCHNQNHSHVLVIPYEWMEIGAGLKKMQNKQFMDSAASFLLIYWWYPSHLLLTRVSPKLSPKNVYIVYQATFPVRKVKFSFTFALQKIHLSQRSGQVLMSSHDICIHVATFGKGCILT